ncbi:hypothetical protein T310_0147, partial [Rasamsonia emersonii CBS 393.64]
LINISHLICAAQAPRGRHKEPGSTVTVNSVLCTEEPCRRNALCAWKKAYQRRQSLAQLFACCEMTRGPLCTAWCGLEIGSRRWRALWAVDPVGLAALGIATPKSLGDHCCWEK